MSRRVGRWTYNGESTRYGVAGWCLDGSPVVLDFMPGNHECCIGGPGCRGGAYLIYNWPTDSHSDHEAVAQYMQSAMMIVEEWWDELLLASLAGSVTR